MAAYLVWPLLVTLLVAAVAAPCVTFYVLLKEHWAEAEVLKRDLVVCRLSSPTTPDSPLSLPDSSFFTSTMGYSTMLSLPTPSPAPLASSSLPQAQALVSPQLASLPPAIPAHHLSSTTSRLGLLKHPKEKNLWKTAPTLKPRYQQGFGLDELPLADQPEAGATPSEDYVTRLERQVKRLKQRVAACRRCLPEPQQTNANCGVGPTWRERRRNEKIRRRREKAEKKVKKKFVREEWMAKKFDFDKGGDDNDDSDDGGDGDGDGDGDGIDDENDGMVEDEDDDMVQGDAMWIDQLDWPSSSAPPSRPMSDVPVPQEQRQRSSLEVRRENHRARQNHRMSTDFRRGFNQKISRMDEALMQFTDTQAAFCKELRDNLGGRLEKRGQELAALSEQVAALVTSATHQVHAIEKLVSEQVYASQQSYERAVAKTQALRDNQLRAIYGYHKQTFLPAVSALSALLSDQASSVTSMGVELITKLEMLEDAYITHATQQTDSLRKVTQEVDMFASKHTNLVMRSKDLANNFHVNTEKFIRELQTRMNNVVKELVLIRLQSQAFVSLGNDTYNRIMQSLNNTGIAVDDLSEDLRGKIKAVDEKEKDFRHTLKTETTMMTERVESGISRTLYNNHGILGHLEEAELEMREHIAQGASAWEEIYQNEETHLRTETDMLANSLQSHSHHTQNILAGLRSAADSHEQVLEEQRMDFQRFVRKRQDALDAQCSAISDWALLMSSELRRRDEDLHRFLADDIEYTHVTVVEDADGYLVSRLADGTLVYHSGRTPTRAQLSPAPNVTYVVENTGPTPGKSSTSSSSTSFSPYSSPAYSVPLRRDIQRDHGRTSSPVPPRTFDTSGSKSSKGSNKSSNSYLQSVKVSNSSSNITNSKSSSSSSSSSKNVSEVHSLDTKDKHSDSHSSSNSSSDDSISSSSKGKDSVSKVNGIDISDSHSPTLRQKFVDGQVPITAKLLGVAALGEQNVSEAGVSDTAAKGDKVKPTVSPDRRLLVKEGGWNVEATKKDAGQGHSRRRGDVPPEESSETEEGDFGDSEDPSGYIGDLDATLMRKKESSTSPGKHKNESAVTKVLAVNDEADEGFRNLRKILEEAEKTIQQFQKDFQIDEESLIREKELRNKKKKLRHENKQHSRKTFAFSYVPRDLGSTTDWTSQGLEERKFMKEVGGLWAVPGKTATSQTSFVSPTVEVKGEKRAKDTIEVSNDTSSQNTTDVLGNISISESKDKALGETVTAGNQSMDDLSSSKTLDDNKTASPAFDGEKAEDREGVNQKKVRHSKKKAKPNEMGAVDDGHLPEE